MENSWPRLLNLVILYARRLWPGGYCNGNNMLGGYFDVFCNIGMKKETFFSLDQHGFVIAPTHEIPVRISLPVVAYGGP
jgi:hypothetical protein